MVLVTRYWLRAVVSVNQAYSPQHSLTLMRTLDTSQWRAFNQWLTARQCSRGKPCQANNRQSQRTINLQLRLLAPHLGLAAAPVRRQSQGLRVGKWGVAFQRGSFPWQSELLLLPKLSSYSNFAAGNSRYKQKDRRQQR